MVSPQITQAHKSKFGQFMTPAGVAAFMAGMFPDSTASHCSLLDAGAGMGALTSAFLDRWGEGRGFSFTKVDATVYEIDARLRSHLQDVLASYRERHPKSLQVTISDQDFIDQSVTNVLLGIGTRFTHAILNPPYKKINSGSDHRSIMRRLGIECVNMYSAFVSLALELMVPGGNIVAIIPRSFCNGPYYKAFRDQILEQSAIRQIHLFASRNKAFKDDEVLQENVIIHIERGAAQREVLITTSTDDTFADLSAHCYPFERIVFPDDSERFIHVPTSPEMGILERSSQIRYSLDDIGVRLSTGPIVDFRLKSHILAQPTDATVPLLYASHFVGQETVWPSEAAKRGNAIVRNDETERWLFPNGYYTVVRRFSSKEEKRRLVAGIVHPDTFLSAERLGFENHLNVFHDNRAGLPVDLAYGLAAFINSTAADEHFRRFNGHTQVNATDLRLMRYPSREALLSFGEWARSKKTLTQDMIDRHLNTLLV